MVDSQVGDIRFAMPDQQVEAIKEAIKNLIPGATVTHRITGPPPELTAGSHTSGAACVGGKASLWFPLHDGAVCYLDVKRENIPLSSGERDLFRFFETAISALLVTADDRATRICTRIASLYSFEHLLVTGYIRRNPRTKRFWTPALILNQLQELAVQRYEGKRCTSGFVFASNPRGFISAVGRTPYRLEPFPKETYLERQFFAKPASFRYVDGRNAFYLVDNWRRVYGVLRCTNPQSYSLHDRLANKHLEAMIRLPVSRVWVAYVGWNDDVNAILPGRKQLRWLKGHWHLIDRSVLGSILNAFGVDADQQESLVDTIFGISDLRLGTVILVPETDSNRPAIAGLIDSTELGLALNGTIRGRDIKSLSREGIALGVFTSDGLTTVAKNGRVIACGEIIDVATEHVSPMTGGGRTQAALAASKYGLSVKVSEDGPVSVFRGGQHLVTFVC
jgi:hypothetical protein